MQGDFLLEFESESGLRVVVEDDGDVAYGYLFVSGKPSSLVWLYNRAVAPEVGPEWDAQIENRLEKVPLNARSKVTPKAFERPTDDDFEVICDDEARSAAIYIRETLHAILAEGAYPGKCALAAEDGPLALRFKEGTGE